MQSIGWQTIGLEIHELETKVLPLLFVWVGNIFGNCRETLHCLQHNIFGFSLSCYDWCCSSLETISSVTVFLSVLCVNSFTII